MFYALAMTWTAPNARVKDLIRQGAEVVLNPPVEWLAQLDSSVSAANPIVSADPELAAAGRRTTRSNLRFWATANLHSPGEPVPGNRGPEPMAMARDMVRRGIGIHALDAYRVGQNVAWLFWMQVSFSLTNDPGELRELLDVTARSINAFVDETMAAINEQMQRERDDLTRGTHAERREVVALVLQGAPISRERAESRLGYRLDQNHIAFVVWSGSVDIDQQELDAVAEGLGHAAGAIPLSVLASTATRWVWISGPAPEIDWAALQRTVSFHPSVSVAVGPIAAGMDGFRRSHLDALTAQQMMSRLNSPQQLASFDAVELVTLISTVPERAEAFVEHTLGLLARADPKIIRSVSAFLDNHQNASATANQLFLHRNTLMRHLMRAESLLPEGRSLRQNGTHIAVALELLQWRGSETTTASKAYSGRLAESQST